jgi:hypothetical protein
MLVASSPAHKDICSTTYTLNLIEDQQNIILITHSTSSSQVFIGADPNTSLANDGLENHGGRKFTSEGSALEERLHYDQSPKSPKSRINQSINQSINEPQHTLCAYLQSTNIINGQMHNIYQGTDKWTTERLFRGASQRTKSFAVETTDSRNKSMTTSGQDGLQTREQQPEHNKSSNPSVSNK